MRGLLDLPDEILIHILLNISHCQILKFAEVHERFVNVLCNKALWTRVNFSRPAQPKILRKSIKYLGKHTKSIRITGYSGGKRPKPDSNVTDSFFSTLKQKCTNLERLCFHDVWFQQPVRVDTFLKLIPDNVEDLELYNCHLPHPPVREKNFTHLLNRTKISKLSLTKCKWLVCKDLIDAMTSAKTSYLRMEECINFSNVAHSVVIKTPRQQLSAQRGINLEPLELNLSGCKLKQELLKCLFTLTGSRITKLTLCNNKNINIQQLFRPAANFKNLEYLNIEGTEAASDSIFIQEIRSSLPKCQLEV